MSGVANPSPAPALTVLNIFNGIKLEKWIACVNELILKTLIKIENSYIKLQRYYTIWVIPCHINQRSPAKKKFWRKINMFSDEIHHNNHIINNNTFLEIWLIWHRMISVFFIN